MRVSSILNKSIDSTTGILRYSRDVVNPSSAKFEKPPLEDASLFQRTFERVLIRLEKSLQNSRYSKSQDVAQIERDLAEKGVVIRFKNKLDTAQFVQKSLDNIKNAGYDLPKYILFAPSSLLLGSDGVATMFRQPLTKQAPIIFPKNVLKNSLRKIKEKYAAGIYSTDNILHYIYHEVGHWLHFQNKPSYRECQSIWQGADQNLIAQEVSQNALKTSDGTEFVAEVFAGLMDGKEYSPHVMEIYTKLKGPTPKH